ncbi:hypothetical protein AK88_02272 [Plasmodium fragile]|uniref:Uncharacterized protein n=1 Tax=Plasmodium fragile TaxID=5857 RepID=A0A0D9QMH1_PLAFR|nr:uncharacterized protein AK88_02272 [Plasmodium fragile]KJP87997.1 hypothetical protein AK88_02272 [Plasmodium fragile]
MFFGNAHKTDPPNHDGNICANRNDDTCALNAKCFVDCIGCAYCASFVPADANVGTEVDLNVVDERNRKHEENFKADNSNTVELKNEEDTHLSEKRQENEHKEEISKCTYENKNPKKGKRKCSLKNKGLKAEKKQTDADKDLVERSTLQDKTEKKLEFPAGMEEKSAPNNPTKGRRRKGKKNAAKNGSNISATGDVNKENKSNTLICPKKEPKEHMNIDASNDQLNITCRNDEQRHDGKENQVYAPCITIEETPESNNVRAPSECSRNAKSKRVCNEYAEEENLINSCNKWNAPSNDVNGNVAPYQGERYIPYEEMKEEHAANHQMLQLGIAKNEPLCESNSDVPLNHFNAADQGEHYYMTNSIGTQNTPCLYTNEVDLSNGTPWNRNHYGEVESSIEQLLKRSILEENFPDGQHMSDDISNEHVSGADIWQGYPVAGYPVGGNPVDSYSVGSHPVVSYPLESYPLENYPLENYPLDRYPVGSNPVESYPVECYPPRWVIRKEDCYSVPEVPAEEAVAQEAANPWGREELQNQEKQNAHKNSCFFSSMNKDEPRLPSNIANMETHAMGEFNDRSSLNKNTSFGCRMEREIETEVSNLLVNLNQGATSSQLHTIPNTAVSPATTTTTSARMSSVTPVRNNGNMTDTLHNQFDLENNTKLYITQGGLRDDQGLPYSCTHMLDTNGRPNALIVTGTVNANVSMPGASAHTIVIAPNAHINIVGDSTYTTPTYPNTNARVPEECASALGHGENVHVPPGNHVIQTNNEAFGTGATNSYAIPHPRLDNCPNSETQQNFSEYQYPYIKITCPNECTNISVETCSGYPYNHSIGVNNSGVLDPNCQDNCFCSSGVHSFQRVGADGSCCYNGTCNCNGAKLCDEGLQCNNCEYCQEGNNFHCTNEFPNHGDNSCMTNTYNNLPPSQVLITHDCRYYQNDPQMDIASASNNLKDQCSQNNNNGRDSFPRCSVKSEYYCAPITSSTKVVPENSCSCINGDNNNITVHIKREQMDPQDARVANTDGNGQSDQYIHTAAYNNTVDVCARNCANYPVVNIKEEDSYSPGPANKGKVMPRGSNPNAGNNDGRTNENGARELGTIKVQVCGQECDVERHLPGDKKAGHTNSTKVKVKRESWSDIGSDVEGDDERDDESDEESGNVSDYQHCGQPGGHHNGQRDHLQRTTVNSPHCTTTEKNDESAHAGTKSGEANSLNYCTTKYNTESAHNYKKYGVENLRIDTGNIINHSNIPYDVFNLEDDCNCNFSDVLCGNRNDTFAHQKSPNKNFKNISSCDRQNSVKENSNLCNYGTNGERECDTCGYLCRINLPYLSDHCVYKTRYPVDDGCSIFPHSLRGDMPSNYHLSRLGATDQVNLHGDESSRIYVNAGPPESVAHVSGDDNYPRGYFYNFNDDGYADKFGPSNTPSNGVTFSNACSPSNTDHCGTPYALNYCKYCNHTNDQLPLDCQQSPNENNYGANWSHSNETCQHYCPHFYANVEYSLNKPFYFRGDYFAPAPDEVKSLSVNKNNTNNTNVSRVTNGIPIKNELKEGINFSKDTNTIRIKSEVANEYDIMSTDVPISSKSNSTLGISTTPINNNTYNLLSISTKCDSSGFNNHHDSLAYGGASPSEVNQSERINTNAVEKHHCGGCIAEGSSNTCQIGAGNECKDGAEANTYSWGKKHFGTGVMENMKKSEDGIKGRKLRCSQMCMPRVKAEIGSERDKETGAACSPRNSAHCRRKGCMHTDQGMRDKGSISVNTEINAKRNANNRDASGYQKKTQFTHSDGNSVQHLNEMHIHVKNINCMYTPEKYNYLNEAHCVNNHVNEVKFTNDAWEEGKSLTHAHCEKYVQQFSYFYSHMSGMGGNLNVEIKKEHADGKGGDGENNSSHNETGTESDSSSDDESDSSSDSESDSSSDSESDSSSDSESDNSGDHTNKAVAHSIDKLQKCANDMYGAKNVSGSPYRPGSIANNSSAMHAGMPSHGGHVHAILDQTGLNCMKSTVYNGTSRGDVNNKDSNVGGYSYGDPSGLSSNCQYGYAHGLNTHSYADGSKSGTPRCTLGSTNANTQDARDMIDSQVDRFGCQHIENDNDGTNELDNDSDDELKGEYPDKKKSNVSIVNVGSVNNTSGSNTIITSLGSETRANTNSSTRATANSNSTVDGDTSPNGVTSVKSESTTCSLNDTHRGYGCIKQCKDEMDYTRKVKSEKGLKRRGRKKNESNNFKYAHVKKKELVKKKYDVHKEMVLTMEEGDLKVIAEEIIRNTLLLPERGPYGRNALDASHPIHSVWKDTSRGNSSWRCRWWENGKRLSKNYNVKRYGELDALKMAIITKLRNSSPRDRILYLNHQREFLNLCYTNNWIPKRESGRVEEVGDAAQKTPEKDDMLDAEKCDKGVEDMHAHETNKQCDQDKDSEETRLSVPLITHSISSFSDDASAPLHRNSLESRRNKRTLLTNTGSSKKCRVRKYYSYGPNTDTTGRSQQGDGTNAVNGRNAMHTVSVLNAPHVQKTLNAVNAHGGVKLEKMPHVQGGNVLRNMY